MATMTQGTVTVNYPDHIEIPAEAGSLSPSQLGHVEKARRGLGLACEHTAEAMTKYPDRFAVPGVTAAELEQNGRAAEDIDLVIADLEALIGKLKQANVLIDAKAHRQLREVLAFVRSREKFDQGITDLVPTLLRYFGRGRSKAVRSPDGDPTP